VGGVRRRGEISGGERGEGKGMIMIKGGGGREGGE